MVRVTLENLTKRFGKVIAADHINLEINDKEFFTLLGPSGGGKTTLLNLIAGLEKPDEGHIYFDGSLIDQLPPEKRDIAMVFQSYALYPHMSVLDNIAIGLKVRKVPENEIMNRVKRTAEMLRISDLLRRKPHQLSGGQRQRVALARAVVREPKVFLLDEPMSNIDAKLRVLMRAELIRLTKIIKITTIYVTHDQIEAMAMSDRVAVINQGAVPQVGKPLEIYNHPSDVFVAGFIGTPPMNFVDCSVREADGGMVLQAPGFGLTLPREISEYVRKRATSSEIILGFRARNVSVSRDKTSNESASCEVYATELLGDEGVIDLKIGDSLYRAIVHPNFNAQMGETVSMSVDVNKIHIFDKRTQNAIL